METWTWKNTIQTVGLILLLCAAVAIAATLSGQPTSQLVQLPEGTAVPARTAVAAARATRFAREEATVTDQEKREVACLSAYDSSQTDKPGGWVVIDGPTTWSLGGDHPPTLLPEGKEVWVNKGVIHFYLPHCQSVLEKNRLISNDWQRLVREQKIWLR